MGMDHAKKGMLLQGSGGGDILETFGMKRQAMRPQGERADQSAQIESKQRKAMGWSLLVAMGNGWLLFSMKASPFPDPLWQIGMGFAAIFLHGWGAWEIGRGWLAISKSAEAEAISSRIEIGRVGRSLAEKSGASAGRPR